MNDLRHPRITVAVLFVGLALVVGAFVTVGARAGSNRQSETIASLSAKVRALQGTMVALQRKTQALETGQPGKSLSPSQTYRRLENLDIKLDNVCRYSRVVTSVTQTSTGVIVTYANC